MKKLLLLPGLLLLLVSSAFAHELTAPLIASAAYHPSRPITASNGRTFLTVWQMNGGLWGSLSDGQSDPPPAMLLLHDSSMATSLVAIGDDYVAAIPVDALGVKLVRISAAGAVTAQAQLDAPQIFAPRLAWNGRDLLLAGIDTFGPYDKSRTRLFLVAPDFSATRKIGEVDGYTFDVASAGGELVIAAGSGDGVRLWRVSADGALRPGFVQVETPINRPSWPAEINLAARPESAIVLWRRYDQFSPPTGQYAVIAGDAVTRREAVPLRPATIVATASGYALARQDAGGISVTLLDPAGAPRGTTTIPDAKFEALAAAGDLLQIVQLQPGTWFAKVIATWLRDLTPLQTALLSKVPIRQFRPSVVSDGVEFLAGFAARTADENLAMAARFARSGNGFDGAGIQLSKPFASADVAVAFGGGKYLAVWTDVALRGAFISSNGAAGPTFNIRQAAATPRAVWNGSSFFVVWSEAGRIWGAPVSTAGDVGTARQISPEPAPGTLPGSIYYGNPDVAWNGREYAVAWRGSVAGNVICTCTPPPPQIANAIRVAFDGTPIGAKAMDIVPYGTGYVDAVHLASSGSGFLMLIDRFVHTEASVIDDAGFEAPRRLFQWFNSAAADNSRGIASAVTFDGSSYVAVFRYGTRQRSWVSAISIAANGRDRGIARAIEVGPPDGYEYDAFAPAVAANGAGDVAVVIAAAAKTGDVSRLHAHFASGMQPVAPPPAAPRHVTAIIDGQRTIITWEASDGADGYLVETTGSLAIATPAADVRSLTLQYPLRTPLRVRAFNAGGVSEPSQPVIAAEYPRRRSTRH